MTTLTLRDELKNLIRGYVNLLETGRERIISCGGQCDSLETMEAQDPYLNKARAALEAQPELPEPFARIEPEVFLAPNDPARSRFAPDVPIPLYTAAQLQQAVEGCNPFVMLATCSLQPNSWTKELLQLVQRYGGACTKLGGSPLSKSEYHSAKISQEKLLAEIERLAELPMLAAAYSNSTPQAKREPMSQAQRDKLIRKLGPEGFEDKDEWDDALIEAIEAHHNIGDK